MKMLPKIFRNAIDLLFPPRKTEALLECTSLGEFEALMRPRSIYGADVLLPYEDPRVRALIWELKYKDSTVAASYAGSLIASFLIEQLAEELVHTALLIPVPLHIERQRTRGYNQCERLVSIVGTHLPHLSIENGALMRIKNTPRQTELKQSARLANMKDAFDADPLLVEGRTCVLIDDVVTTGATLSEAKKTLLRAGASRVLVVALAYA